MTDLAKWQADLKSYVDTTRSKKEQLDPAILRQFDQSKLDLINAAVHQMNATLTPVSWAGIHAYINDEHRLHTRVFQYQAPH